ncbi:hypothetical protein IV203_018226 [Nitzschia inconspicua]|uniref:Uncharacterized protein n=1 Tax=Nitzschia inconspicua TaxID=303405 RepID=A0A9K3M0N9_9STRA|nr:hypothetical protein IV203_018226 [Nitzschia inconspicua]
MTVSLSTCSSTNHYSHQQHDGSFGWSPIIGLGLMATVAAATTSTTSTMMRGRCDAAEEVVEDPYDNLPEKDEPTHCSICLTYRQGPCRPYWRKVEACTKDNELPERKEGEKDDADDDDDNAENNPDPPCLKYMMPWIDCASGYRNLYALIEMDTNYTEGIQDLESTSKGFCWAPGKEPKVDWQPWQDYVELLNPEWKVPRSSPKNDQQEQQQRQHFWKSLDHSEDPEIVQVEATVATTMVGGGVLECAYAVDQNGDVIGFAYGTKPSEAAKGEIKETSETTTMTIRLVPSRTRQVVLAAAYTYVVDDSKKKKPTTSSEKSDDDAVESHVYKSRPFHLVMVADRKTKINIARGAA